MSQTLQSVGHALQVLQVLRERGPASVTELAGAVGVGPSTAHRLLATLQKHGFAEQTAGRRYQLGPSMRLSPEAAAVEHCIQVSEPFMQRLRDRSKETVHISTLSGTMSKFVAAVESRYVMRVTARIGRDIPAHTSAAGKVLLAQLTEEQVVALYPDEALPAVTTNTLRTRTALLAELEHVREVGYGRNFEESELGLVALAVPIARPFGRPVCCLTLTGPTARFNPHGVDGVSDREREFHRMLNDEVRRIEHQLTM